MTRVRLRLLPCALLLALITLLGFAFLFLIGIDALEGRSSFQFFADSDTYHAAATGGLPSVEGIAGAVTITGNFLGPLLILWAAGENYYAVLVLNALIMYVSLYLIAKAMRLDAFGLLVILLLNPMTVSSLLSVNKEILALFFIALLIRAYVTRSAFTVLLALIVSVLARWQLTVFLVLLLILTNAWNPLRNYRLATVLVLLAALSAIYVVLAPILEPVQINFESAAMDYEGSGLFEWLVAMQNRGYYWLIFPLKAIHLLFISGLRFDRLLKPEQIYNDVWQLLHSTATLILCVVLWRARRLRLSNDLVFFSVVYVAVFATTPIYAARYFYAVYVLWAIALVAGSPNPPLISRRGKGAAGADPYRPVPIAGEARLAASR
jgi:hypothetical protein